MVAAVSMQTWEGLDECPKKQRIGGCQFAASVAWDKAAGEFAGAEVALNCSPDRRTVAQDNEDDSRRCTCSAAQHAVQRHVRICVTCGTLRI